MKKYLQLTIVILCAALCFNSCASYKDIRITDAQMEQFKPGAGSLGFRFILTIDNPASKLDIHDITGTLKLKGKPVASLTCDNMYLKARSINEVEVNIVGKLYEGLDFTTLFSLTKAQNLRELTVDLDAGCTTGLGLKRVIKYRDVKVTDLVNGKQ